MKPYKSNLLQGVVGTVVGTTTPCVEGVVESSYNML